MWYDLRIGWRGNLMKNQGNLGFYLDGKNSLVFLFVCFDIG